MYVLLQVNEEEFTVYLPVDTVMTITTLTGQEKGSFPNVPPSAQFPVPYSDTFDSMSNILTQVYIYKCSHVTTVLVYILVYTYLQMHV